MIRRIVLIAWTVFGQYSLWSQVAITRGDTTVRSIALVFTGDEFADGGYYIDSLFQSEKIKASFFLTGNFLRNNKFGKLVRNLVSHGHYLGSHSDRHLLYCDWNKRDSLLVTRTEFDRDLLQSYRELQRFGITKNNARYFLPPYEWYNDSIVSWTSAAGLQLVNFSPGTRSTADYTYPEMGVRYLDSETIYKSIIDFEKKYVAGLNGFILLVHIGTDPRRSDKFYYRLPALIRDLKGKGYHFARIDELLDGINHKTK